MNREIPMALIRALPVVCLCLLLRADIGVAQSGGSGGAMSGLIVLIEPDEPKGMLRVIQARGLPPVNAAEKMLIRRGNLLILDPSARATVLCGDHKLRKLGPGLQPSPCTEPCPSDVCGIVYDGSKMRAARGTDTDNTRYPVVISPRKTLLLNSRPAIRWAPIAGAKMNITYKVILYGENMRVIWSREVNSKTTLPYPDNAPSLERGKTYKVVVVGEGRDSEEEHSPGLRFTTLTADQARALAGEVSKLRQLGLPEKQTSFLISNLYAAKELYSEAIDRLIDSHSTMKEAPVARTLGDLYMVIGLNREAEKMYLEALRLQDSSDLEAVAVTQKSLAQTCENLGIFDQAVSRLQEAIRVYELLGDTALVEQLKKREQLLKKY